MDYRDIIKAPIITEKAQASHLMRELMFLK